jgi:hypothetical protein
MSEFKTIAEPATVICPKSLPISRAYECEFTLNIGMFFDGTDNNRHTDLSKFTNTNIVRLATQRIVGWLVGLFAFLLLSACAMHADDLVPDHDKVGAPVAAVGHYGSMIGIPEYSIDGFHAGNNSGWGGGGKTSCCILLPRVVTKPIFATVKWQTCDVSHIKFVNDRIIDPNEECKLQEHEATVPIHFAVQPGDSSGLYVHFLPGLKVELWMARGYPNGSEYPGPKYPFGPPPPYKPLLDEKPMSSINTNIKP